MQRAGGEIGMYQPEMKANCLRNLEFLADAELTFREFAELRQ